MLASFRSLAFSLSLITACLTIMPGQATTVLRGYVNENHEAEAVPRTSVPLTGQVDSQSFPSSYVGTWRSETTVVDSAIDSVSVGQKMISDIQFVRRPDGRVHANWNQPGWTETQVSTVSYSTTEASTDRTNYYYGEGLRGAWAARSRDKFTQLTSDKMMAQSYIDQYIDGQYLGRYRTKSILYRIPNSQDVALK